MGGSPQITEIQYKNPAYPIERFGVQFSVDNKPFEDGIDKINNLGILDMLGAGIPEKLMMSLASNQDDEKKKELIRKGILGGL